MSDEIIKILDDLATRFCVAIDWTAENVIPYLKELFGRLVTYEIIKSSILIAVGCIMLIGCAVMIKVLVNDRIKCKETKEDTMFHNYWNSGNRIEIADGAGWGSLTATTIVGAIGIFIIGWFVDALIKWAIIPEFQIITWIDNMIATM